MMGMVWDGSGWGVDGMDGMDANVSILESIN